MSKKCRLTVPYNKQHGKRALTLFKSERRQSYQIYWLLWRQLSLKKSFLVIYKILRPFVNTFTAHRKYSVLNKQYLLHPIHMQLTQKQKTFSEFFFAISKARLNFEHTQKKKMILIGNAFPKLRPSKNAVR